MKPSLTKCPQYLWSFENSLPQVLYCIQVKLILLQLLFLCEISTLNPTPFPSEAPADWWLVRGLGSFGGKSLKHKSSKLWEGEGEGGVLSIRPDAARGRG